LGLSKSLDLFDFELPGRTIAISKDLVLAAKVVQLVGRHSEHRGGGLQLNKSRGHVIAPKTWTSHGSRATGNRPELNPTGPTAAQ
jgi:hypothetical protein